MNISTTSTKDEIVTAALELTDYQAEQINQLQGQQQILWGVVAVLAALLLA